MKINLNRALAWYQLPGWAFSYYQQNRIMDKIRKDVAHTPPPTTTCSVPSHVSDFLVLSFWVPFSVFTTTTTCAACHLLTQTASLKKSRKTGGLHEKRSSSVSHENKNGCTKKKNQPTDQIESTEGGETQKMYMTRRKKIEDTRKNNRFLRNHTKIYRYSTRYVCVCFDYDVSKGSGILQPDTARHCSIPKHAPLTHPPAYNHPSL